MTIIQQLNQLAEAAPDVCRIILYSDGNNFVIGDYVFWFSGDVLNATYRRSFATTDPALAWLEAALRQMIEARGWGYTIDYYPPYDAIVWQGERVGGRRYDGFDKATSAEALLDALIKALGGGEG